MKSTGIIRRIDDLGRVIIPKEIRNTLLLQEGDPMEIFADDDGRIYLKKYMPDYNLSERIEDVTRRFNAATEEAGHKNAKEIRQRLKELKELWEDC